MSRSACDAVIFDMDGVITKTAEVHFRAWKKLFDEYMRKYAGSDVKPFDHEDYRKYVDGKPRYRGIESFLESRGIKLSWGNEEDGPDEETIYGLGNKKNVYFHQLIEQDGVELYQPAVPLLKKLRSAGFKTAVVSSSKNCAAVLEAAGIFDLFDNKTDGVDVRELKLQGKPSPDIFLKAAEKIQVTPQRAVVLEDAISGVQAGKRGGFGLVIGVDRTGHGEDLRQNGADVVITDLSVIKVDNAASSPDTLPSALEDFELFAARIKNKKIALFLDYDGTLAPIVDDPDQAVMTDDMREVLMQLAELLPVAIISGRDRPDVQNLVGIKNLYYAGSHGFDIAGPDNMETVEEKGKEFLPALDLAEKDVRQRIENIQGAWVERKKYSIAVHYRKVDEKKTDKVEKAVRKVAGFHNELKLSGGKKIFELQPKLDWHKGKALMWLLDKLNLDKPEIIPMYIGDDVTDEDAFKTLADRGIGVVVMDPPRDTKAGFRLKDPDEVTIFLNKIIQLHKGNI